jgi:hypothetical protein
VCRFCHIDLRARRLAEVAAVADDATACADARAAAARELAERLQAQDLDDEHDEQA